MLIIKWGADREMKKTKSLVQVSLMAAIIFLAAYIIHLPTAGGVIHLGDCMVFVAAALLGRKKGAAASAIGMALFDLLSGYAIWAPFTFVIKGVMAYIAAIILERNTSNIIKNQLVAFIVSSVWMVTAYYFSQVIIGTLLTGEFINSTAAFLYALKDVPTNIFQAGAGVIIAIPIIKAVEKKVVISKR